MFRELLFWPLVVLWLTVPIFLGGVALLFDGGLPAGTPPANAGAFEGGSTATFVDAGEDIPDPEDVVAGDRVPDP